MRKMEDMNNKNNQYSHTRDYYPWNYNIKVTELCRCNLVILPLLLLVASFFS